MFQHLPSNVSYKWSEAIKPQLMNIIDSNKFDECLQSTQQEINSVLQHHLTQAVANCQINDDTLITIDNVLMEFGRFSEDIYEFINQFAIDSLASDQLFSQIFNESLSAPLIK
jgi:hypothetical protein